MPFIDVIKPGLLTTVQDAGRWGFQTFGVPVAGPMDPRAHRLANRLVGNSDERATLETTLIGPELRFAGDAVIALAGAICEATLDDRLVPMNEGVDVVAGQVLKVGQRTRGARTYLAVAGGLDVPAIFGSRATHVSSRMGGLGGRALRTGDRLPIGMPHTPAPVRQRARGVPLPDGGARLRVLTGPDDELFVAEAFETLFGKRYLVSTQSDRMAYRLDGPTLARRTTNDIISDATTLGVLQVPASGQPILLMADRGTSGGYARIATVITADIGMAGQLAPGDWVEFSACDRADALRALIVQEQMLLSV